MVVQQKTTTIEISVETRDRLIELGDGKKGETYEMILRRILDNYKNNHNN